jgi:hypothetical protein
LALVPSQITTSLSVDMFHERPMVIQSPKTRRGKGDQRSPEAMDFGLASASFAFRANYADIM